MPTPADDEATTLAPDDAFAVLGNETRMEILQTLAKAADPLSFSELRDRVGVSDSGQFNYHLDKLGGHFVDDSDEGYRLQRAGERVIEAVLSGAVTEAPVVERTKVDEQPCPLCGASTEVRYRQERVEIHCPECGGTRGANSATVEDWATPEADLIGYVHLPPAGVHDRDPDELPKAGGIWTQTEVAMIARDLCPQCSAPLDHSVNICEDHDSSGSLCDRCDQLFGVTVDESCTNCIYEISVPARTYLGVTPEVMGFIIDHGYDPLSPDVYRVIEYKEEIASIDPIDVQITYTIDDDVLTLTLVDGLSIVEVTRRE